MTLHELVDLLMMEMQGFQYQTTRMSTLLINLVQVVHEEIIKKLSGNYDIHD